MRSLILLVIFLLQAFVILSQTEPLMITGNLLNSEEGDKVYLSVTIGNVRKKVDSFPIINDQFKIDYDMRSRPNLITLNVSNSKKRLRFWVDDQRIEIKAKKENFSEAEINGALNPELEEKFLAVYNRDESDTQQLLIIKNYLQAPSAVYHLYRLSKSVNKELLGPLYDALNPKWQEHDFGRMIRSQIDAPTQRIHKAGDPIYDFVAEDQNGNTFQLSKTIAKKHVLLEFRSHYCMPSRSAIPEMERIHAKMKDKINIVTFIDDTDETLWYRFLDEDKTDWKKVWDGEGEIGVTCVTYGAIGSPHYVIISPEGIVIDKWSLYAEGEIESRVKKALKP